MKFLDLSYQKPEMNLALDESLLDAAEYTRCEVLRFWESPSYFVVLGYSNKFSHEVFQKACDDKNVPILRRSSGGGTVLQGPGCLNFCLILLISRIPNLKTITKTNCYIMQKNRSALQKMLQDEILVEGHTDLTMGGVKFSGNAQRRHKHYLLFHGTFLYRVDLAKIRNFLPIPSKQPAYRINRSHQDFLTNIPASSDQIKKALRKEWTANEILDTLPSDEILDRYVREKYGNEEWNRKY